MKKLVSSWILLTSALALALSVVIFSHAANTPTTSPADANSGQRPSLRGARALGPFTLFDANHDGVLSADEIAGAPAALRKLDKNGDGKLTTDELRPHGPPPPPRGDHPEDDMPPPPPTAE